MKEHVTMSLGEVHDLAMRILLGHGLSAEQAEAIARAVTNAERDECRAHGLFRVSDYVAALKGGRVNRGANPEVRELAPGVIEVDGQQGFLAAGARGRACAARRASSLAGDCRADRDQRPQLRIALARGGSACGGGVGRDGVCRLACGRRAGRWEQASLWDQSGGLCLAAERSAAFGVRPGDQCGGARRDSDSGSRWSGYPRGLGRRSGRASDHGSNEALRGAQLPFGSHKGAAFSLMVELLAGVLLGFDVTAAGGEPGARKKGELIVAFDPNVLGLGNLDELFGRSEALFEAVLEQEGTRLPSDRRYAARARTAAKGISIPVALYDTLLELQAS